MRIEGRWLWAGAGGQMRKTNPICPGRRRVMEETCKTNPIPGHATWGVARGAGDVGQMRKTNPICPARAGRSCLVPRPSALALRRRRLCKTNPIWPGRRRVMEETCKTKPNLGGLGCMGKGGRRVGRGSPGEPAIGHVGTVVESWGPRR